MEIEKFRKGKEVQALDPELGMYLAAKILSCDENSCRVKWTSYRTTSFVPRQDIREPMKARILETKVYNERGQRCGRELSNLLPVDQARKICRGDHVKFMKDNEIVHDIVTYNDPFERKVKCISDTVVLYESLIRDDEETTELHEGRRKRPSQVAGPQDITNIHGQDVRTRQKRPKTAEKDGGHLRVLPAPVDNNPAPADLPAPDDHPAPVDNNPAPADLPAPDDHPAPVDNNPAPADDELPDDLNFHLGCQHEQQFAALEARLDAMQTSMDAMATTMAAIFESVRNPAAPGPIHHIPNHDVALAAPGPGPQPNIQPVTPRFLPGSTEDNVVIGNNRAFTSINRDDYSTIMRKPDMTGLKFVLKLLSVVYTKEALKGFNMKGGATIVNGGVIQKKKMADEVNFKAIWAQAEKEFEGCTSGPNGEAIRRAISNKCNKARRSLDAAANEQA